MDGSYYAILTDACKNGYCDVVKHILITYSDKIDKLVKRAHETYTTEWKISNKLLIIAGNHKQSAVIDILLPFCLKYSNHSICSFNKIDCERKPSRCIDPHGYSLLVHIALCEPSCIFFMEYVVNKGVDILNPLYVRFIDIYSDTIKNNAQLCVWLHKRGISYYYDLNIEQTRNVINYDETAMNAENINNKHVDELKYIKLYLHRRITDTFKEVNHKDWDHLGITNMICEYVPYADQLK